MRSYYTPRRAADDHRYKRGTVRERIARKSAKMDDCTVWTGACFPNGYGILWVKGKNIGAHRAAYEAFVGPIPEGMLVLHRCDNPPCVNPEHLFLGTARDNTHDMIAKGRHHFGGPPGERCGASKLTETSVREIRRLFADGTQRATIARQYGVRFPTIVAIVTRRTWRHVT